MLLLRKNKFRFITFKTINLTKIACRNISFKQQDFISKINSNKLSKQEINKRIQELINININHRRNLSKAMSKSNKNILFSISNILITGLILGGVLYFYMKFELKFTGILDNKSFFEEVQPSSKMPTFNDVCGNQEAKEELKDIVHFLKHPEKFRKMGATVPKGVLLSGPPGCGKTLLARALAGEANVTFLSTSGSSFEEIYVGLGSSRIRKLFRTAREKTPCIIFLDEIDAIGTKRTLNYFGRMSLNQILSEIDGFNQDDEIIIIAATNMPSRLDPALTRSGRFDRIIDITFPDLQARKEMLELNIKGKKVENELNLEEIAKELTGFSGADIKNLINLALTETIKANKIEVTSSILYDAIKSLSLGKIRKSMNLSPKIIKGTAIHEAGHTITALYTKNASSVNSLTVLPRGHSLGSTWLVQKEGAQYVKTKEELISDIDVAMGGFVAEELVFGKEKASIGSVSDFQNATKIALGIVQSYGMCNKIGKVVLVGEDLRNCSTYLKDIMDNEVKIILDSSYKRVCVLMKEKESILLKLAEEVMAKNTLSREEILDLVGKMDKTNGNNL